MAPRELHSAYTARMSATRMLQEAADSIQVVRRLEGHGRLVVCRAATDVDDDPAIRERHTDGSPDETI